MTASEPKLPDDFSGVEEIGRDSGRLRVTLEILVAILVLFGIYYLFAPAEEVDLPPLQPQEIDPIIRDQIEAAEQPPAGAGSAAPTMPSGPANGAAENPGTGAQEPADPPRADGEAARDIIAAQRGGTGPRPLSEINRLAAGYQQQGDATDAYLLWFYAARQGDGEAAFALANLYDPNHFEAGNSLLTGADATQAYKWYRLAAPSVPQAAQRLQALRTSLQAQAEAGDMTARRLLLNWQ